MSEMRCKCGAMVVREDVHMEVWRRDLNAHETHGVDDCTSDPWDWRTGRPGDGGRTLALTLTDEYLAEVEATLDKVRQVFDRDGDAGVGFDLQHARECPAYGWKVQPGACGCGIITTLDEIQHALATLRTAREQLRVLATAEGR